LAGPGVPTCEAAKIKKLPVATAINLAFLSNTKKGTGACRSPYFS